jgi:hypothetical protein
MNSPEFIGPRTVAYHGRSENNIGPTDLVGGIVRIRMMNRQFIRLTKAFSKKLEDHKHSIALHFMHYNFCRIHMNSENNTGLKSQKGWTAAIPLCGVVILAVYLLFSLRLISPGR